MEKKEKPEKKKYAIQNKKGERLATYTGHGPMQVAIKAARRGIKNIYVRQIKTKKIVRYKGRREEVEIPVTEKSPQWMQDGAKNNIYIGYDGFVEKIKEKDKTKDE